MCFNVVSTSVKYCGNVTVPDYISVTSVVKVYFHSDSYSTGTGFRIEAFHAEDIGKCGSERLSKFIVICTTLFLRMAKRELLKNSMNYIVKVTPFITRRP